LRDININTTLEQWDSVKLVSYFTSKDSDIVVCPRQTGSGTNQDLMTWFHSSGSRNLHGADQPDLDAAIESQFADFDLESRREKLQTVQREIAKTAGSIFLTGTTATEIFHPYVQNAVPGGYTDGQLLENIWLDV